MKKIKQLVLVVFKNKVVTVCIIIILLSLMSMIIKNIDRKSSFKVNSSEITKKENKIVIYITGEIKNPGVYEVDQRARLDNVIDIAGGLTEFADINKLNLAKKVIDSEKIIIPKISEKTEENYTDMKNDYIEEAEDTNNKININKADISELTKISGIGEATAKKIIEYRKNNNFDTIEDIMNVSGIGESKFNSIKDQICVE